MGAQRSCDAAGVISDQSGTVAALNEKSLADLKDRMILVKQKPYQTHITY